MTKTELQYIKQRIIEEENKKSLSLLPPEFLIPICCSVDTSIQDLWMDYYLNNTPLQFTISWIVEHIWWSYPTHHEDMSALWPNIRKLLTNAEYTNWTMQMGDYNPVRTQTDCLKYLHDGLEAQLTEPIWDTDDKVKIKSALLQLNNLRDIRPITLFDFLNEQWRYMSHTLHPENVYEALLLTTSPIAETPDIRREVRHVVNSFIKICN
jgi:hypothetical protein